MKRYVFLILVLCCIASVSFAQTAQDIVEKANLTAYYQGQDGVSDVRMTITDTRGRQRIREFRILRMTVQQGAEQKFYVYFQKPTDVARMTYMVWKNIDRDDDRWLYLPAMDLVRRIAASDRRSSFVGSHFVYEDVSGRGTQADIHELISDDQGVYKIKSVPKDDRGLEFSWYVVSIDQEHFMPVKIEYYNNDGKIIRIIEALEIQEIQGFPTVVKSRAIDMERGGETLQEFFNVRYDVGLTEEIFTERFLRRPPLQWIQ